MTILVNDAQVVSVQKVAIANHDVLMFQFADQLQMTRVRFGIMIQTRLVQIFDDAQIVDLVSAFGQQDPSELALAYQLDHSVSVVHFELDQRLLVVIRVQIVWIT